MAPDQTVGAWNARMAAAPVADAARLIGGGGLVVLAPHPDDETLGCSALILDSARSQRKLGIVALTDGEGSHRASRTFPPARLASIRAEEQRAALTAFGCPNAEWLRLALPDGASGRSPDFASAIDEIVSLCRRTDASALAAPHPQDPHPDHHAAARLALAVRERLPRLRILFYEVWSRRLGSEEPFDSDGLTPFKVRTDVARKRVAIECHASQLGHVVDDDPEGFALPQWFLAAQDDPLERMSWLALPGALPGREHFGRLYAGDADPWHVRSSAYEIEKRNAALNLVSGRHYRRSLEAGCGEGHLTGALVASGLVEHAVGFDREPSIVDRAGRMGWGERAHFETGSMPREMPSGPFDLVILSEVLYFLDEQGLAILAMELAERLAPSARLLVVCYKGRTDTPLSGRDAADVFAACLGEDVKTLSSVEAQDYRMEFLERS